MDFQFSESDIAFRDGLNVFLDDELPSWWTDRVDGMGRDGAGTDELWHITRRFQKKLSQRGWLTLGWPERFGGGGAGFIRQALFAETMAYRRAPVYNQGVDRVGPTLMVHGSDDQQQTFLPQIRNAEIMWCQGFSEPESGSDLASLQMRAIRKEDQFVINGQKIWTSYAHLADWMFLLARTDLEAPKHKGISYFVVKMDTPGISVRPLINMAGSHHFNEVFFEDVRVPVDQLVGEENYGWYIAATTLDFERSGINRVVAGIRTLNDLTILARRTSRDGSRLLDKPSIRHRLAQLHIDFSVARLLAYRVAWMQSAGLVPNHEASISKMFGSELRQRLGELINIVGVSGQLRSGSPYAVLSGRLPDEYLNATSLTIAAGTSEIQRNIIATRGLGLPRS